MIFNLFFQYSKHPFSCGILPLFLTINHTRARRRGFDRQLTVSSLEYAKFFFVSSFCKSRRKKTKIHARGYSQSRLRNINRKNHDLSICDLRCNAVYNLKFQRFLPAYFSTERNKFSNIEQSILSLFLQIQKKI